MASESSAAQDRIRAGYDPWLFFAAAVWNLICAGGVLFFLSNAKMSQTAMAARR